MTKELLITLAGKFSRVNTVLSVVSGIAVLVMTGIVFYAVAMRYAFNMPPTWTTETSNFLLLFTTFMPLGFVFQHERHITVDFFTTRMTGRTLRMVNVGNGLMAAALFGVLCWQSVQLARKAFQWQWVSMEMNIPLGYPYLIVPIACGLMVISCLCKVLELMCFEAPKRTQE